MLLAVPYIFVDNPMSYLGGREAYGYAKTMGRFSPESGLGEAVSLQAYGGNFGRDEGAAWRDFLELEALGPRAGPSAAPRAGLLGLLRHLVGDVTGLESGEDLVVGGMRLAAGLLAGLAEGEVGQVFLKQFRDAGDGTRACYQAVVEAPVRVSRMSARPAEQDSACACTRLDSHPIEQELGLRDQAAELSFEVEVDFVVEDGVEVGSRRAGAAGRRGDAARWRRPPRWLLERPRERRALGVEGDHRPGARHAGPAAALVCAGPRRPGRGFTSAESVCAAAAPAPLELEASSSEKAKTPTASAAATAKAEATATVRRGAGAVGAGAA